MEKIVHKLYVKAKKKMGPWKQNFRKNRCALTKKLQVAKDLNGVWGVTDNISHARYSGASHGLRGECNMHAILLPCNMPTFP